jgi:hypothetical protein
MKGIETYKTFQPPTPGYKEQVFFHDLKEDHAGRTYAALINPKQKLGAALWVNKKQLDRLIEWKQMGEGAYVLGLEPSNCYVDGRAKARENGTLKFIEPGEVKNIDIEIQIIDGDEEIDKLQRGIIA